jgi:hypothetical protein
MANHRLSRAASTIGVAQAPGLRIRPTGDHRLGMRIKRRRRERNANLTRKASLKRAVGCYEALCNEIAPHRAVELRLLAIAWASRFIYKISWDQRASSRSFVAKEAH